MALVIFRVSYMYVEYGVMVLFNPSPWYEKNMTFGGLGPSWIEILSYWEEDYTFHL